MATAIHLERPLIADDLAGMPDDGRRYEIVGGELIVSPSPSQRHQNASTNLLFMIRHHLGQTGSGMVFAAPFDVRLGSHDIVQPDLLVVLERNRPYLRHDGVSGAPDLVIEIVSPASMRIDRVRKAAIYATFGVPEYWIVDPDARTILAQSLENGQYQPLTSDDGLVHSRVVTGMAVDPVEVFAMPDWMVDEAGT